MTFRPADNMILLWPPLLVVFALLPFLPLFLTRMRLWKVEYVSGLCLVLMGLVAFMWARNAHSEDIITLNVTAPYDEARGDAFSLKFRGGGIALMLEDTRGVGWAPYIKWRRSELRRNPEYPIIWKIGEHPQYVSRWGFVLLYADNMRGVIPNRVWQAIVPSWFAMLVLGMAPMYLVKTLSRRHDLRRHLRNARRWGLCENPDCRYDLRATASCGDGARWCPECNHRNPPAAGWKRGSVDLAGSGTRGVTT